MTANTSGSFNPGKAALSLLILLLCSSSLLFANGDEKTIVYAVKTSAYSINTTAREVRKFSVNPGLISAVNGEARPVFPGYKRDLASPAREKDLPDLGRWFQLTVPAADSGMLLEEIRQHPRVEVAFIRGNVYPAALTPSLAGGKAAGVPIFVDQQGYLADAPEGCAVRSAWKEYKIKGRGVTVADIEGDWYTAHHDLKSSKSTGISGVRAGSSLWYEHGTAELGLVVATKNQYGITGIAHKARPKMFSIFQENSHGNSEDNVANAILMASEALKAGDVIYLPIEYREDFTGNRGFAVEYYPDVFEAIFTATYKGIIVIEAAGNGGLNLNSSLFNGRFKVENTGDSGAIMVGAGGVPAFRNLKRLDFSNFGDRLDLQNWGTDVVSTGYGDLYSRGKSRSYTDSFDGTSSATGITAGVCALVQEYARKELKRPLTPFEMRKILVETGTPQEGKAKGQKIGPRPDLLKALAAIEKMN